MYTSLIHCMHQQKMSILFSIMVQRNLIWIDFLPHFYFSYSTDSWY
jgi:hypothetical protein